jgi:hypothetical protein
VEEYFWVTAKTGQDEWEVAFEELEVAPLKLSELDP